jgi:hypothetical protein
MTAVYVLWSAYYVGYESAFPDLAMPAGSDTVTIALWLAGFRELVAGSSPLGMFFMVLASGTTWSAPVLTALALTFLMFLDRERGWTAIRLGALATVVLAAVVAAVGWLSGDWADWVRQLRVQYVADLVDPERHVAALPLFTQFLLSTAGLPLLLPFAWRRLSVPSRVLSFTGAAYLAIVLAGNHKNLHYLAPLPWILLGPVLEATRTRLQLAATVALAMVFALSWPEQAAVRREAIDLGRVSCVQGFDYEAAALAADSVYQAFNVPGPGFELGKQTFVRYAMDLGGRDCVIGLSPTVPPGAIAVVDDTASVWVTDVDRYARWWFHPLREPSSVLFPQPRRRAYPADAAAWTGRLYLTQEPGRALLLTGFADSNVAPGGPVTGHARLLVPVPDAEQHEVWLGLHAPAAARVQARVNGNSASGLVVEPDREEVVVQGSWRPGWNLLELGATQAVGIEWMEVRRAAKNEREK